jgi:ABC-2 type transport system ATP-binding protein
MIRIQNLKKIYGNSVALDDVSFQCERGKITGLLGPNGAGKTTTMRILAGFLKSSEGSVEYDGFDFNQHEIQIKKRLGYLPESAPLYADMIVQEFLEFMAQARGIASSKILTSIHRLVDLCKLESHLYSPIHQLSKGFKQRVALAGTLIHDPDFIILDEPSSGLDPNQITIIRHLIQKLGKDKTIILSTHILQEVIEVCDQVVILSKGKVVLDANVNQLGVTERIFFTTNVNLEFIQKMFRNHNLTDIHEIISYNPKMYSYSIDTKGMGGEHVFKILAEHNLVASEIRPFTRSLETIFSELTNKG